MPRRILALLTALILLACAVSFAEEEESESRVKRIEAPVVLPLLGMSPDEILSSPENRALFCAAAFLEADVEGVPVAYDAWLAAHPSYAGTIDEGEGLLFAATDGVTTLDVYYWPDGGFVLYSLIDNRGIDLSLADQLVENAVRNNCGEYFAIPPEDIPAALAALGALSEGQDGQSGKSGRTSGVL